MNNRLRAKISGGKQNLGLKSWKIKKSWPSLGKVWEKYTQNFCQDFFQDLAKTFGQDFLGTDFFRSPRLFSPTNFSQDFHTTSFFYPQKKESFFLGPRLSKINRLDFIPLFLVKSCLPQTFAKKILANGTGKNTQFLLHWPRLFCAEHSRLDNPSFCYFFPEDEVTFFLRRQKLFCPTWSTQ